MVQFYSTDWDFIVSRADALGYCVAIDDGAFSVKDLAVSGSPVMKFDWGISEIFDLEFDADASHQFAAVESQAWDAKNLQLTGPTSAKSVSASQGNLNAGKIASTLGFDKCSLISSVPLEPAELKVWADGTLARSRAAMLRGRISVSGSTELKLLDVVEFGGCGTRFNGTTSSPG